MDSKQNFNLTTSVSTPIEYYKILVLQRLNDLNEAWEMYAVNKYLGVPSNLNYVHARTESLFNALMPYLERKMEEKAIKSIMKILFTTEPNEQQLREIFFDINRQLDIDRITRMDTKAVYDGTRVEVENNARGL
jgi:hypothetical protein